MAFLSKVGNLVRQAAGKQISLDISSSRLSLFQTLRCMSSSKLFVGGLSYGTDEQSLRESFARYGELIEARVIMDRETGRSRGFGFVTYTSSEEASTAMQALDGADLQGRRVRVNYATERSALQYGGGGGYGGGGYGGGGGRGYEGGSYNSDPSGYNSVPSGGNLSSTGNTSLGPENDYRATGNYGGSPYNSGNPGMGSDGTGAGEAAGGLKWDERDTDRENMSDNNESGFK